MKHIILKILVVVLALGNTGVAFAQTGTPGSNANPRAVQRVTEVRQNIATSTKNRLEAMMARIKNQISHRYSKTLKRFQAVIDRETVIMNKINSRIAKIKALGGNTTEAEKVVAEAKIHLDEAMLDLEALEALTETQVANGATGTTTKALREGLNLMKASSSEIEKHLREAHKNLQKSVGLLRGVSQLNNASTTKQN